MSESLKTKQLQTSLQAEKQVLNARMQHANATADLHKQRITRLEEQVCTFCIGDCILDDYPVWNSWQDVSLVKSLFAFKF